MSVSYNAQRKCKKLDCFFCNEEEEESEEKKDRVEQ